MSGYSRPFWHERRDERRLARKRTRTRTYTNTQTHGHTRHEADYRSTGTPANNRRSRSKPRRYPRDTCFSSSCKSPGETLAEKVSRETIEGIRFLLRTCVVLIRFLPNDERERERGVGRGKDGARNGWLNGQDSSPFR